MSELVKGYLLDKRYLIVSKIGRGGMGSVYLAKDQVLAGELLAVKVLKTDLANDEIHTQRFFREVQLMRKVNHINVVRTYDVGAADGYVYFTMEYVPGKTLSEIIDSGEVTIPLAVNILDQVSSGLQAIHSANIVHRDLKPGNIIVLENGYIKIADFGVARPAVSKLTAHNEIVGSVHYMAPEVWLGKEIGPASDYYSLGIILYEMLTTRLPFDHERPATLMWMHVKSVPEPPINSNNSIPPWLNRLILRLLSKSPLERPSDHKEIEAVLKFYKDKDSAALSGSVVSIPAQGFVENHLFESTVEHQSHRSSTSLRFRSGVKRAEFEPLCDIDFLTIFLSITSISIFSVVFLSLFAK